MTVEIIVESIDGDYTSVINAERAWVKANGWVKYREGGDQYHLPPHRVHGVVEDSPKETNGGVLSDSDVVYESPHGRV